MAGRLLDIPSDVPGKEIASAWAWPAAMSQLGWPRPAAASADRVRARA